MALAPAIGGEAAREEIAAEHARMRKFAGGHA